MQALGYSLLTKFRPEFSWAWALPDPIVSRNGVLDAQAPGVQGQSGAGLGDGWRGIQGVAQDGPTLPGQMNPQLVATSCDGTQGQQAAPQRRILRQHPPPGLAGLAPVPHMVARAVGPVHAETTHSWDAVAGAMVDLFRKLS